jgi:hypothetical protein
MQQPEPVHVCLDHLVEETQRPLRRPPRDEEVAVMAERLAEDGLTAPLIAYREDDAGRIVVVDGRCRLHALVALDARGQLRLPNGTDRNTTPVVVLTFTRAYEQAALANNPVRPLTPGERVRHIQALLQDAAYKKLVDSPDVLPDGRPANPRNTPGATEAFKRLWQITTESARQKRRLAEQLPSEQVSRVLGTPCDQQATLQRVSERVQDGADPADEIDAELADQPAEAAQRRTPQGTVSPPTLASKVVKLDGDEIIGFGHYLHRNLPYNERRKLARAIENGGERGPARGGALAPDTEVERVHRRLSYFTTHIAPEISNQHLARLAWVGEASISELFHGHTRKTEDLIASVDQALDQFPVPHDPDP